MGVVFKGHKFLDNLNMGTSVGTSDPIDVRDFGAMGFSVSGTGTSITYYGAPDDNGPFYPLYDPTGGAVTQSISSGRYISASPYINNAAVIKLVGNATGTIEVFLKF